MARGLAACTVLWQLYCIPEFPFPWLPVGYDAAAGVSCNEGQGLLTL